MTRRNLQSTIGLRRTAAPAEAAATLAPTPDDIREQLPRILASRFFSNSERLSRFLSFAVDHALNCKGERLKEYFVGVEVFDRKSTYDPRIDPIVRVEARRLRSKLKLYYTSLGREDRLLIEFPKGTYTPSFRFRTSGRPRPRRAAASVRKETAIAVLPFANLTRESEDDYFSDGLTEELIHRLTRLPNLRVVAWHSASQLRGRDEDLRGLRELLNVDVVLRGSVRRASGNVRVTAQLIDTTSGAYLWSETYDRDVKDVFSIQEGIAQAIVTTLQLALASPRGEVLRENSSNPESYNLYLQGRFHWNKRTGEGLRKSIQCFEDAASLDPNFALPYAGLADAYTLLADYGLAAPADAMPRAKAAALKALDLNPECGEAYNSLALISSHFDWNWPQAELLYRRAIELNPGYSTAHHWFGIDYLAVLGRLDEAGVEIQSALQLDPLSLIIHEGQASLCTLRRDYDEALVRFRQLLELDPSYYKAYSGIGRVYIQRAQYEEAIAMLEKARSLASDVPNILGALGQAFALAGRKSSARRCMEELMTMAKTNFVPCTTFAVIHLGLGENKKALDLLRIACDQRLLSIMTMKVHPLYDPLRSEPGFSALLERIGLA